MEDEVLTASKHPEAPQCGIEGTPPWGKCQSPPLGALLKQDMGPQALHTGCVNMLGSTFPMEGPGWGSRLGHPGGGAQESSGQEEAHSCLSGETLWAKPGSPVLLRDCFPLWVDVHMSHCPGLRAGPAMPHWMGREAASVPTITSSFSCRCHSWWLQGPGP